MGRITVSLLLGIMVSGCAGQRSVSPDSPNTILPVGSTIVLEQPLSVDAGTVSFWIQNGKRTGRRNVYYPACKLEMWTRAKEDRTIAPDEFRVTRVTRDWMVGASDLPFRQAVLSFNDDDGGPSLFVMATVIYLKSASQPDVYRLTCEQWEVPPNPEHVTINEMISTLRGVMRIEMPPRS
jgi:hypothetical protein